MKNLELIQVPVRVRSLGLRIWGSALVAALLALSPAQAAGPGPFMRELTGKETCTEADAIRAAAIFAGEREKVGDLAACTQRLTDRKILKDRDGAKPDARLSKGFASMLFARAMGIKGGYKARIFGLGRRIAYQELEFMGLVPGLGDGDLMTGAELVSLFRSAQEYQKKVARRKADKAIRARLKTNDAPTEKKQG